MAEKRPQIQAQPSEGGEVKEGKGLLDQIIDESRMARDESQKGWAKSVIGEFVKQIIEGNIVVSEDLELMITSRIRQLDRLISAQLNEVMHHPDLQKLEASWRGLYFLVNQSETGAQLKIRVMSVSKQDLLNDMEKAYEFDRSALFKKIYLEEFGQFGGTPYGVLIGAYEFGIHPLDLFLLERVSQVASAAHAPFIAAAAPSMFNLDSFTELGIHRDMAKIFQAPDFAKWNSLRDSDDSRYVALVMPHILMRLPYGRANVQVEAFNYEEDADGADHSKYLWGNAAFAFGARLIDAFGKYHWCAAIRGVGGGGLVRELPVQTLRTDEGDIALKCPTEIGITDRREKELADLGFIPLVHCRGTDYAAFLSTQTINKPKRYDTVAATDDARRSSQLQYILAVSRFAHYLKCMVRDRMGSFMMRKNLEDFLNAWINKYVLPDVGAGQEERASHPLREARVDVLEIEGRPGVYRGVAFLKPYYQLDELTVSLRLVVELA